MVSASLTSSSVSNFDCDHLPYIPAGKLEPVHLSPLKPSSLAVPELEWPRIPLLSSNDQEDITLSPG